MTNQKARRDVTKGLFALLIGFCMIFIYQKWQVTGWLGQVDNVIVTILVVIVPLILVTEVAFCLFRFVKDKFKNSLE